MSEELIFIGIRQHVLIFNISTSDYTKQKSYLADAVAILNSSSYTTVKPGKIAPAANDVQVLTLTFIMVSYLKKV